MDKVRVLIVEDNDELRESLAEVLAGEGYDVRQAAGGHAAEQMVPELAPCVVLLDLRMPIGSGDGFLGFLDARPQLATRVAVIVISSDEPPPTAVSTRVRWLSKPFPIDDLLLELANAALAAGL